ncbi:MAG TPA: choice-of-anchor Q domain-containing protein [Chiayiivirga sp.]|nr:choice-of-anchor Q domain-containing protein [Chiayiivirga sp.]
MPARRFASHHPLVAAVALALGLGSAHAATITVTSGGDAGSGSTCTLRQAIEAANTDAVVGSCAAGSGDDVIQFAGGLANSTITLAGTELAVSANLQIVGSGQTLDANDTSRVLNVADGVTLLASNLTVTGGQTAGSGGGIFVDRNASLTLSASTVTGNSAGDTGGGIYVGEYTQLTLTDSTVSNNVSTNGGGGIYGWGYNEFGLSGSTISGNSTGNQGGGIYSWQSDLTMTNCTVTGNSVMDADSDGGGVWVVSETVANLRNSTISGNSATGTGGGVFLSTNSSGIWENMILSANTAADGVDLSRASNGGGKRPTHVAKRASQAEPNGAIFAISASLLGTALSGDFTGNGNVFNDVPGLGSLANNGGPTQTLSLQAGSPAIDAGNNALIPPGVNFDQRGSGFSRVVGGTVDMGAFELAAVAAVEPTLIPAGSPWSLALLGGLLGLLGIVGLRSIRS